MNQFIKPPSHILPVSLPSLDSDPINSGSIGSGSCGSDPIGSVAFGSDLIVSGSTGFGSCRSVPIDSGSCGSGLVKKSLFRVPTRTAGIVDELFIFTVFFHVWFIVRFHQFFRGAKSAAV